MCDICQIPELINNQRVLSISFQEETDGSEKQHIHRASVLLASGIEKIICKTIYQPNELYMLQKLETLFPKTEKRKQRPHMRLLGSKVKQGTITLILQCGPPDLFHFLETATSCKSALNKRILYSLVKKVSQLHKRNIAHMDLSVENVLFGNDQVFLIDFQFSQFLDPQMEYHFNIPKQKIELENKIEQEQESYSICFGKQMYLCKDHMERKPWNGFQADIFAIGVIAFLLFFKRRPFHNHEEKNYQLLEEGCIKTLVMQLGFPSIMYLHDPIVNQVLSFIAECCSITRPRSAIYLLKHNLFA